MRGHICHCRNDIKERCSGFSQYLLASNNPFTTIDGLPPPPLYPSSPGLSHTTHPMSPPCMESIAEGRIEIVVDSHLQLDDSVVWAVFVGPGSLPPERTMFHIGSGRKIEEDNPLWEIMAYPYFHPSGNHHEAWSPSSLSLVGTRLRHIQCVRSVMFYEPYFWKSSRIAHQFLLDAWARNEQKLVQVWRSPTIQSRIRGYLRRVNVNCVRIHSE